MVPPSTRKRHHEKKLRKQIKSARTQSARARSPAPGTPEAAPQVSEVSIGHVYELLEELGRLLD